MLAPVIEILFCEQHLHAQNNSISIGKTTYEIVGRGQYLFIQIWHFQQPPTNSKEGL